LRIAHQARAEHAVLHAIGRATYVQVDLIITALFCQFRAMRKLRRITPPTAMLPGVLLRCMPDSRPCHE
jgi:hypothetical protein